MWSVSITLASDPVVSESGTCERSRLPLACVVDERGVAAFGRPRTADVATTVPYLASFLAGDSLWFRSC